MDRYVTFNELYSLKRFHLKTFVTCKCWIDQKAPVDYTQSLYHLKRHDDSPAIMRVEQYALIQFMIQSSA